MGRIKHETKIDFTQEIGGQTFRFDGIRIQSFDMHSFYPTMMGVSQCIRQFIKQKFGKLPFGISTDSFSNGDSVRLFFSPLKVSREMVDEIKASLTFVQFGRVNSQDDSYRGKKEATGFRTTYEGQEIEFSTKFLQIEYRPKPDSKDEKELEQLLETVTHVRMTDLATGTMEWKTENGELYVMPAMKISRETVDKARENAGPFTEWIAV